MASDNRKPLLIRPLRQSFAQSNKKDMASIGVPSVAALGAAKTLQSVGKLPEFKTVLDAYSQMSEMPRTIHDLDEKLRKVTKQLKELPQAVLSGPRLTVLLAKMGPKL